jgi:hypothetical protein
VIDLDDGSQWAIVHSRFRDPLDVIAEIDPEDPFIRSLVAQRERIGRQYEEIVASVPEGMSPRERDEYVAARAIGTIVSNVATEGGTP